MRYFTVQEANAFVPALRETFGEIEKLRFKVVRLVGEMQKLGVSDAINTDTDVSLPAPAEVKRQQIALTLGEIRTRVRDLEEHGLIVKQLDGQVDFRSKRGQRPVYLSWRKGQEQVDSWHEVWNDAESPQPVDQLFRKPLLN